PLPARSRAQGIDPRPLRRDGDLALLPGIRARAARLLVESLTPSTSPSRYLPWCAKGSGLSRQIPLSRNLTSILIKRINMSWLTRDQALKALRVRPQTLYAYVSRGRIGMRPDPEDPRRSLYDSDDIAALTRRRARGKRPEAIAASTISWG